MSIEVVVTLMDDASARATAERRGWPTESFTGLLEASNYPWMFWNRVRPTSGRHCAPVDLPPMYEVRRA
jgi:hypothetical protein